MSTEIDFGDRSRFFPSSRSCFSNLVTPFKVWVAHEGPITKFALEEVVDVFGHSLSQDGVQFCKILGGLVVLRIVGEDVLRGLAKGAERLVDALVLDGDGKVVTGALLATPVLAAWHLHHLPKSFGFFIS